MEILIQILALIGLLLSFYAITVENRSEKDGEYKAFCDVNDRISCTKAFSSPYGKTFGISNSIYGIIFYLIIIALGYYDKINYVFYLSVIAFVGSLYLAYLLYFKVKTFCLVCNSIYVVNILLLISSYLVNY